MSTTVLENLTSAIMNADNNPNGIVELSIIEFDQWSIPMDANVGPTQVTWDAAAIGRGTR